MYAELLLRLHQNEIHKEIKRISLQEEALKGKTLCDKYFSLFGIWMISFGKKLRRCYLDAKQEAIFATFREN